MLDLALQRLALRSMLSLPAPILRMLSGGSAVYLGGKTMDPRFQAIAYAAQRRPAEEAVTPETARARIAKIMLPFAGKPEPGVSTEAFSIDGPGGIIPCRVYRPAEQDVTAPVIVYAHGGGGVIGDLEASDTFCVLLSAVTHAPVVSVDYRLAPEHRYPAGVDDVLAVYRHARDHARTFGAPTGVAAIGGDSQGANYAAVVCQDLKAAGEPQPVFQLLIYPVVDWASETASMATYGKTYPLGNGVMEWFSAQYMGPEATPSDVRLSPIHGELAGLAPAIIVTAGFDPLLDQGLDYAKALKAASVPVTYRTHDSLIHGFIQFTGVVPAADVAAREMAGLARAVIEGRV